jgi:hypothetical protein
MYYLCIMYYSYYSIVHKSCSWGPVMKWREAARKNGDRSRIKYLLKASAIQYLTHIEGWVTVKSA